MELLVFGHAGAKVLVFPTREGRFYDYENWGMVNAVRSKIDSGAIQLFCVDSVDTESLYCHWRPPAHRLERHQQYERYILNEVIPLMRSKQGSQFLIAHGCSIGAYHAVTIALRHPGLFGKLVALSGRYDLTRPVGPFADLFEGFYSQDLYFYTPTHFLPQLNDCRTLGALRQTQIVLAIGEEDPFYASTVLLSEQMNQKGIWNNLAIWNGEAHRPRYWRPMVQLYL